MLANFLQAYQTPSAIYSNLTSTALDSWACAALAMLA